MPPYTHGHTHTHTSLPEHTQHTCATHAHLPVLMHTHLLVRIQAPLLEHTQNACTPPCTHTPLSINTLSVPTHPRPTCTHAEARTKALIIRSLLHRKLHSIAQGHAKEGLPQHLFSPSMFSDSQAVPVFLPSSDKCLSAYQGCRALLCSPSSIF